MTVKWMSEKVCNICNQSVFVQGPEFYDASVREFRGSWALLCFKCAAKYTMNMGQVYDSKTFEKKGNIKR